VASETWKKKLYLKPYTLFVNNNEERLLFTILPRKAIYKLKNGSFYACERVGYMVLKVS
jgi:hypothetical protein